MSLVTIHSGQDIYKYQYPVSDSDMFFKLALECSSRLFVNSDHEYHPVYLSNYSVCVHIAIS